jgi:signal peptidase I
MQAMQGEQEKQLSTQSEVVIEKKPEVKTKEKKAQSGWELLRFGVIALVAVFLVRTFIVQPFIVSGSSMFPTFQNGQYLIVDEISYKLEAPKRDDVIVFRYPDDTTKFFIKRIIGLPGETVDIKGNDVYITNAEHPTGFKLDEPFVENTANNSMHFVLTNNQYFVMGDNRPNSSDSRYWGPVPKNLLIGRVFLRLWPVNGIGVLPGHYTQAE